MSCALTPVMFQSSPNLTVGCLSCPDQGGQRQQEVSILTQPHGRVPQDIEHYSDPGNMFQSSPNLTVGCLARLASSKTDQIGFNPHPTSRSGASCCQPPIHAAECSFNPHPTSRSGASCQGCDEGIWAM